MIPDRWRPVSDLSSLCAAAAPAAMVVAAAGWGGRLIGAVGVLRPLQLHLESFHADLEAVH